jgi:hypothetical protein
MGRLEGAVTAAVHCSIVAFDLYPLLTKERVKWRVVVKTVLKFRVPKKADNFLTS